MKKLFSMMMVVAVANLSGCVISPLLTGEAPLATIPARQIETQKITLGTVQSKIKVGVSGADVIDALGSPNIVTQNNDKSETWVYDKVITESETATGANSSVSVRSSRTLIVTVKFGLNQRVKDVSYRQTSY